jgi:hypothetical protein
VKQIGEPLQAYIKSKKIDLKEFLNISIDKDTIFDILIDSNHVLLSGSKDEDNNNNTLKDLLEEYGAIVIRIVDDSIKQNIVKTFVAFNIALSPTIHFSYSSGNLSSVYRLMLVLACCLRYEKSLLIVGCLICNILDISDWL